MTLLEPGRHREPRYKAGRLRTGHFPRRGGLGPVWTGSHSPRRHSSWSRAPLGPSRQCLTFLDEGCLTPGPGTVRLLPGIHSMRTQGPWAPQLPRCGRGLLLLPAAGHAFPCSLLGRKRKEEGREPLCGRGAGTTPSMQAEQEAERFPLNPHLPSKNDATVELQRALSVCTSPLDRSGSRSASG